MRPCDVESSWTRAAEVSEVFDEFESILRYRGKIWAWKGEEAWLPFMRHLVAVREWMGRSDWIDRDQSNRTARYSTACDCVELAHIRMLQVTCVLGRRIGLHLFATECINWVGQAPERARRPSVKKRALPYHLRRSPPVWLALRRRAACRADRNG